MKKIIFSLVNLVFFIQICNAQTTDSASVYYKKAVSAFKNQNYVLADSLYGISIYYQPHPNAFFNRAIVRSELHDRPGYCECLSLASGMGDTVASKLFFKHCGKTDTMYTARISKVVPSVYAKAYQVSYRSQYMKDVLIAYYRMNNSFHSFSWAKADSKLEVDKASTENVKSPSDSLEKKAGLKDSLFSPAEFPGGIPAMMKFLQQNTQYPAEAREAGISGKVYLQFIINTFGYIQDIEVIKGIPKCKECDAEAVRIISIMPRWRPAKINGKEVPTYFKTPFSFKIG